MAYELIDLKGDFSSYTDREGGVGIGHEYQAAAIVKRDEHGAVIGPGFAQAAKDIAEIIWAAGIVRPYREPYGKFYVKASARKIRALVGSSMIERRVHMPAAPPRPVTAWEAVDYALRGGWGFSDMFAKEFLNVDHPYFLTALAKRTGTEGKLEAIKEGLNHLGQCVVESFVVDEWLGDGQDETPWLPGGFTGDDGQVGRAVDADDMIDPNIHDDGYRYNWGEVERAGFIYWAWLNQHAFEMFLASINQVDSSIAAHGGETA